MYRIGREFAAPMNSLLRTKSFSSATENAMKKAVPNLKARIEAKRVKNEKKSAVLQSADIYSVISSLKKFSWAKFDETVEISVNLGVVRQIYRFWCSVAFVSQHDRTQESQTSRLKGSQNFPVGQGKRFGLQCLQQDQMHKLLSRRGQML